MADEYLFELRTANIKDMKFAEELYLCTMEPLLSALGDWDEEDFRQRIKHQLQFNEYQIVQVGDRDIGFIQITASETDLNLAQIHLLEPYRNRGVGSALVRKLLARAARENKTASLSAPRNNPAIALYRRLGYKVSKDDGGNIIDMQNLSPSADMH